MATATMTRRSWALALIMIALALADAARAQQPSSATFYQDFRGSRSPQPPLGLFGPDAALLSHAEEEGWRVTVPADQPMKRTVGLVTTAPVQGDFTITAGYQILQAEQPHGRVPAGFELFIVTNTPTDEAIGLARWVTQADGEVYTCSHMSGPPGPKRRYEHRPFPAQSKTGSLRVIRKGHEVAFWADEGTGDYRRLTSYHLGADDLKRVRLVAFVPPEHSAVDLCIVDLRISADALAPEHAGPAEAGAISHRDPRRMWVGLFGLIGLIVLILGAALYFQHRRRAPMLPARGPEESDRHDARRT
jgi:hypothetical protein